MTKNDPISVRFDDFDLKMMEKLAKNNPDFDNISHYIRATVRRDLRKRFDIEYKIKESGLNLIGREGDDNGE